MSYSFVDLKKKTDLTKTQHAKSKAAVKTFEILLCFARRAGEAIRGAKVDIILQKR